LTTCPPGPATLNAGGVPPLVENVAAQLRAALIVTTPPVHPVPLQPLKTDPLAGVAVSVTTVPLA
jgi:hypothetical protein